MLDSKCAKPTIKMAGTRTVRTQAIVDASRRSYSMDKAITNMIPVMMDITTTLRKKRFDSDKIKCNMFLPFCLYLPRRNRFTI